MTGRPPGVIIRTRTLRRVRLSHQLLHHLVVGAAIAGLAASARYALFPPAPSRPAPAGGLRPDPAAAGFAEMFARRYLTWDTARPGGHAASLAPLIGTAVDPDAGLRLPYSGSEHVGWSAVVQDRLGDGGEHVYTVAAEAGEAGELYLSVAVRREADGRLALSRYPSFVGPPAVGAAHPTPTGSPVNDPALSEVVGRALGNYLASSSANLAADLAPGAAVAPPTLALSLQRVVDLRWSPGGGAVQATVDASDARGAEFTLTYELDVALTQDRWEISAIQMNPTG